VNSPGPFNLGAVRRRLGWAFVAYHRGLGKMPRHWKPWLLLLLCANMIMPLCFANRFEARVIFLVALLNGAIFVVLTAISGFSRLLGLGHVLWIPLIYYLWGRLDQIPSETMYGLWIRAVIILDAISLVLDASNVARYIAGERSDMVPGLGTDQALDQNVPTDAP